MGSKWGNPSTAATALVNSAVSVCKR
jgi:hypothetical protein